MISLLRLLHTFIFVFLLSLAVFGETLIPQREKHQISSAFWVYTIPTAANSPGRFGAYFKTNVVLYNPTFHNYKIHVFLANSKGIVSSKEFDMPPLAYYFWENFLEEFFGYRGAGAVLFDSLSPPGGSEEYRFSVYAEVYTDSPNGRFSTIVLNGTPGAPIDVGTNVTGIDPTELESSPLAELLGRVKRIVANPGIIASSRQRVNIGITNLESGNRTYVAVILDGDLNVVRIIPFPVPAYGWAQKSVPVQFAGSVAWGCLQPSCIGIPWVVTVDNSSNDGTLTYPTVHDVK